MAKGRGGKEGDLKLRVERGKKKVDVQELAERDKEEHYSGEGSHVVGCRKMKRFNVETAEAKEPRGEAATSELE